MPVSPLTVGGVPLQNRVTPLGELVAESGRGLVYGNRGCLHDAEGRIRRRFNGKRWIACRLSFKGWHRSPLLQPGRFTELFFLDEATAFAAGHRPCALCRREDYKRFVAMWSALYPGDSGADAIDARLHAERVDRNGERRLYVGAFEGLPAGAFVVHEGGACVVRGGALWRWTMNGYTPARSLPVSGSATVITPPSIVEVLRAGWTSDLPLLHPSASA